MKQITAKQYAKIRPFLPVQRGNVRIPNIAIINAILHVLENGCKWRALPERFGKWYSVYARFRRWSRSGVLDRLFAALQELHAPGGDANCFGRRPRGGNRRSLHQCGGKPGRTRDWRPPKPETASCPLPKPAVSPPEPLPAFDGTS